jgi:hypothetical protein
LTQAKRLTDATFPTGWNPDKCLIASVGRKALPELEHWEYTPQIRAVPQLPHFKTLPPDHSTLVRSPWFQSPSQAAGFGLNARHLRYHHQLWNDLRPKTLRGMHTTLVYVTPQLGFSLTPHIRLDSLAFEQGILCVAFAHEIGSETGRMTMWDDLRFVLNLALQPPAASRTTVSA